MLTKLGWHFLTVCKHRAKLTQSSSVPEMSSCLTLANEYSSPLRLDHALSPPTTYIEPAQFIGGRDPTSAGARRPSLSLRRGFRRTLSRPSPGLQNNVSELSSPLGHTRQLLPLFYYWSALPDCHRGFRIMCPSWVALSDTHASYYRCFIIDPHFQTVTGTSELCVRAE